MTTYKVETFRDTVGDWEGVFSAKPDYRFATVYKRRRLLWHRRLLVVTNAEEAEELARKQALAIARPLRKAGVVRIVRVADCDGHIAKNVVWQNGRDVQGVSWWGVIKRWWGCSDRAG